ncbi:hypothetical protein ACNKHN_15535 [Shigella flexneri]
MFIPWEQIEPSPSVGLLLALVIAIVKLVTATVIALLNSMAVCGLILLRASPGPGLVLHFSVRLLAGGVIKESLRNIWKN